MGACVQPSCPRRARIPQIVAHRGSSRDEPEHTLKAYLRAIDEGADALECDVRLTADGHLVCVHDRRVNRTSNGVGRVVHPRAGRPSRAWTGGPGRTRRRRRGRDARPRPQAAAAHAAPPADHRDATAAGRSGWRSRPSTRPATPARSSGSWPSCSPSSAWTDAAPGRPCGAGDVVLPAARPSGCASCAPRCRWSACREGQPLRLPRRRAAQGRADGRPRHRDPARHPGRRCAASTSAGTRSSSGPSTRRPTSTCAWSSGSTRSSPTGPAFVRDHAGLRP